MRKGKRHKGSIWIFLGLLLIAAALILTGYNLWLQKAGEIASKEALQKMELDIKGDEGTESEIGIPPYVQNPEMAMPIIDIDGIDYIGTLEIPALKLMLPIISEWDYSKLRIAPCRYTGSAYLHNLVIAAHNYSSHFGNLKSLAQGDIIKFTDAAGNVFIYEVIEMETLQPFDIEEMVTGDWDLTLFTCTIGGQSRITIRCEKSEG